MKKIVIFGCGGHSRGSVADVLLALDPHLSLVFVDENAKPGEEIFNFPVVQQVTQEVDGAIFFAIGDNGKRKQLFQQFLGRSIINIISPLSHKSYSAQMRHGIFVGNFCHIGPYER